MPAPDERAERGLLAIADLSGYSDYLAGSELDHAQGVLRDLLETVGWMTRMYELEPVESGTRLRTRFARASRLRRRVFVLLFGRLFVRRGRRNLERLAGLLPALPAT